MDNMDVTKIPLEMVKKMMKRNIDDINRFDIVEYKTIFTNFGSGDSSEIIYEIEIIKDGNRESDIDA